MSIEEYHGFHGTNKSNALKILGNQGPKTPPKYLNSKREPGNFGYGFYVFLNDARLAFKFARKFNDAKNVKLCSIFCEADENTVLDLRDEELRQQFLAFTRSNQQSIINNLNNFGNKKNNLQILTTGIAIELFISFLKQRNHEVSVVIGESYTKEEKNNGILLTVPNGTEMSIRELSVIKKIEEYDYEKEGL
ncbi:MULTISPECIES: hypothetical protein [Lactobacillales]|uniref:hypothetical protein n=1 Tax=Lactobacillales TaxID=186826 RepID=UPI0011EF57BD|nr:MULTISPECIES: hypothetical protein [unclassified Carnobacterium]KAF3299945.1 hypothetical protein FPV23_07420 [Carnobacterium sp. PL17RED31]KAF3301206.1 hypothetical protein FPV22_05550 [Carnobacterium sp. PL26RED25]KAF3305462.1 hypothetical protein FPV24_05675 [Carnobacterium sp. PL24RED07]KAF3306193.1 hypothetical protein FPV25_02345 [Carnobacterium sp. PL17GRE32]